MAHIFSPNWTIQTKFRYPFQIGDVIAIKRLISLDDDLKISSMAHLRPIPGTERFITMFSHYGFRVKRLISNSAEHSLLYLRE